MTSQYNVIFHIIMYMVVARMITTRSYCIGATIMLVAIFTETVDVSIFIIWMCYAIGVAMDRWLFPLFVRAQ